MSDIQIMKDTINGLIEQGKQLRKDEAMFIKAQGLSEAIVKAENDRDKAADDLADEKDNLKSLKAKKQKAVSGAATKIESKMNEILPLKNAVFDCTDGLKIGVKNESGIVLYNGLSGGQKQVFDAALSNVLDANIIVIEAAEVDNERMMAVLEDLTSLDKQVIINTHLKPHDKKSNPEGYRVPDGFSLVELV